MNQRNVIIILLCLLVACVTFMATWQWRSPQAMPDQQTPLAEQLQLSAEQWQRLEQMDPHYYREVTAMAARLQDARQTLAQLLEDEQAADMQILEQVEQVITAHNALERRVAEYMVAMRRELEPDQRRHLGQYTAGQVRRGMGQGWRHPQGRGMGMGQGMGQGMDREGRGNGRGAGRMIEQRPDDTQPDDDRRPLHDPRSGVGGMRQVIDFLFENHQHIERHVEDLPNGVLATTTSDDPQVAEALRRHVRQMKQRLEAGQPMRRGDPLFRELFEHRHQITMQIEDVPGGVRVRQTSENPQVVLLIRQHAHAAVSQFIEQGPDREHQFTPLPQDYRR